MAESRVPLLQESGDEQDIEEFGQISDRYKIDDDISFMGDTKHGPISKTRAVIGAMATLMLLVLTLTCGALLIGSMLPGFSTSGPPDWSGGLEHGWTRIYDGFRSESATRLVDVDGDGILDVIFAISREPEIAYTQRRSEDARICKALGVSSPCGGHVIALRGIDGRELWRVSTHMEVFAINCAGIDVNQDGTTDCLCSGRFATFLAIDPLTGKVLWRWSSEFLQDDWSIFYPLPLADWDRDGVPEVLITHSGNPRYGPQEHEREPGRLILISGATGRSIGPYINMTDGRESYMSPLLHRTERGQDFVIFGTGGETVTGGLYAVAACDLHRYFLTDGISNCPDDIRRWAPEKPRDSNGIFNIFRAREKGLAAPPLLIDMTKDGVKDIMLVTFDAEVVLLDGQTLQDVWQKRLYFPGYEVYSSPVPGLFTDDVTPDITLHLARGTWPLYNQTLIIILDGETGEIIWSMSSKVMDFSSDLVLRTTQANRDVFLFRVAGREDAERAYVWHVDQSEKNETTSHHTHTHGRKRRHFELKEDGQQSCQYNSTESRPRAELFMVDRSSVKSPLKVGDSGLLKYYYNITEKGEDYAKLYKAVDGGRWFMGEPYHSNESDITCAFGYPVEISTGAVGDVDGDGHPEVIVVYSTLVQLTNWFGTPFRQMPVTKITKTSLKDAMSRNQHVITKNITYKELRHGRDPPINAVKFLPDKLQTYAGYMGTDARSTYEGT